jgi:RNA polymerase sigma factor (sigma-70 family)
MDCGRVSNLYKPVLEHLHFVLQPPTPMPARFSPTSVTLLNKLKSPGEDRLWQASWRRFNELYHEPIKAFARQCYIRRTGGQEPGSGFLDDAVANVVAGFCHGVGQYKPTQLSLRGYLRMVTKDRVIDLLRKERPIDHKPLLGPDDRDENPLPDEQPAEEMIFNRALLATLIEDLRKSIPTRQFECFERVILKSQSPQSVAKDLGMKRAMVDRNVYKARNALRKLVSRPEYQDEFD